jgi:NAD-dependent dihydropyrimidine dehydrogenase PreA subunit
MPVNQSRNVLAVGRVILVVAIVVFLSFLVTKLVGEKTGKAAAGRSIVMSKGMTVEQFGRENGLDNRLLKKIFGLKAEGDLKKTIESFPLTLDQIAEAVTREGTLNEEYESRNWILIPVKFGLWTVFLAIVFAMMRKSAITAALRRSLYFCAVLVFGVILGSDPNPMGTVKDAIVLLGAKGVIFPPRLIAMTLFLVFTLVANKFICSWGCQFGTLQDLIFRVSKVGIRGGKHHLHSRYRLPFLLTNTIRIAVFFGLSLGAFLWGIDVIQPVDPFKIYRPAVLGLAGALFLAAVLATAVIVYRPWCHFFCPFGLVSWLVEKVSIYKIKVNYDTCIACGICAESCPSTVMDAILRRTRTIPDCFGCATCIEACPTKSIRFAPGKRIRPPEGKFTGSLR